MKQGQKLWTREELILAINLYCKLPFGKLDRNTSEVKHLAKMIGRTDSSVAFKLNNFASLDPSLQARGVKGAVNSSKLDKEIWNEFYNNWNIYSYKSEELLAQYEHTSVLQLNKISEEDLPREGKDREQSVRIRVNQCFFRSSIMAAYNNTCCITGIKEKEFLIAGHIKKWSEDIGNRMNPRNGIAINALHDKLFEAGFMTITPEYKIKISPILLKEKSPVSQEYFKKYDQQNIILPSRFLPDPEFLKFHNNERFKG